MYTFWTKNISPDVLKCKIYYTYFFYGKSVFLFKILNQAHCNLLDGKNVLDELHVWLEKKNIQKLVGKTDITISIKVILWCICHVCIEKPIFSNSILGFNRSIRNSYWTHNFSYFFSENSLKTTWKNTFIDR